MARPLKTGLDYFPHDVDAGSDPKIEALTALHGNDGYAFYFRLLEFIYRTEGGELDLSNEQIRLILPRRLHLSRKRFEIILADACSLGLFDKQKFSEKKLLTSLGILEVFQGVTKMRERWRDSKVNDLRELSLSSSLIGKPHKENPIKERKEKERKAGREGNALPECVETAKAFFFEQHFSNPETEAAKFFAYYGARNWECVDDWRELAKVWNSRTLEYAVRNGQSPLEPRRARSKPLGETSWKSQTFFCSDCGRLIRADEICICNSVYAEGENNAV